MGLMFLCKPKIPVVTYKPTIFRPSKAGVQLGIVQKWDMICLLRACSQKNLRKGIGKIDATHDTSKFQVPSSRSL